MEDCIEYITDNIEDWIFVLFFLIILAISYFGIIWHVIAKKENIIKWNYTYIIIRDAAIMGMIDSCGVWNSRGLWTHLHGPFNMSLVRSASLTKTSQILAQEFFD